MDLEFPLMLETETYNEDGESASTIPYNISDADGTTLFEVADVEYVSLRDAERIVEVLNLFGGNQPLIEILDKLDAIKNYVYDNLLYQTLCFRGSCNGAQEGHPECIHNDPGSNLHKAREIYRRFDAILEGGGE